MYISNISGQDGKITFTGIPSGHDYILNETTTPEKYIPATHQHVKVSYDKTYLSGVDASTANLTIINEPMGVQKSIPISLSIYKKYLNGILLGNEFTFELRDSNGALIDTVSTITDINTDNNTSIGKVTFNAIELGVGNYQFAIREINQNRHDVKYDTDTKVIYAVVNIVEGTYDSDDTEIPLDYTITYYKNETIDENKITPQFVNEHHPGSLTVTKEVVGNDSDNLKNFGFTVTLSDNTINGTKGDMTFVNGIATFTLKHGESKTATGLPSNTTYTVQETDNGGYNIVEPANGVITGTITQTDTALAKFTNSKTKLLPAVLNIKAEKTLDNGTLTDSKFEFALIDEAGNSVATAKNDNQGNVTFAPFNFAKDGTYKYTLKEVNTNDKAIIYDSTVYTLLIESKLNNTDSFNPFYEASVTYYNGTEINDANKLDINEIPKFENKQLDTGLLTVTKTVDGLESDKQLDFNFKVTLDDDSINGYYGEMFFVNGMAEFTLKADQDITADKLPAGTKYKVEETPNNYFETGEIEKDKDSYVEFLNTRKYTPIEPRNIHNYPDLEIIKRDFDTDDVLKGAEFTLTDEDGNEEVKTTNSSGIARFRNLDEGTYTLEETKAPKGYTADDTVYTIVVTEVDKVKDGVMTTYYYDLEITPDDEFDERNTLLTVYNDVDPDIPGPQQPDPDPDPTPDPDPEQPDPVDPTPSKPTKPVPPTGIASMNLWGGLALASLAGLTLTKKRRNRK